MARTKFNPLQLLLSSFVSSYTNTGTGGGTGYYINLGGIKICWGVSGTTTLGGSGGVGISLPSSFFTTPQYYALNVAATTNGDSQVRVTDLTGTTTINGWYTASGSANIKLSWLIIGI